MEQPKYYKVEHTKDCFYDEVHQNHIVGINFTTGKAPLLYVHTRSKWESDYLPSLYIVKKHGIPITKEEFKARFKRATECNDFVIND